MGRQSFSVKCKKDVRQQKRWLLRQQRIQGMCFSFTLTCERKGNDVYVVDTPSYRIERKGLGVQYAEVV